MELSDAEIKQVSGGETVASEAEPVALLTRSSVHEINVKGPGGGQQPDPP